MDFKRISSVEGYPIDLDEMKSFLRVDSDDDDAALELAMGAAASFMERRTGYVLVPGTFDVRFDEWPLCEPWEIALAPLRQVTHFSYMSEPNTFVDVDTDQFVIDAAKRSFTVFPIRTFQPSLYCPYSPQGGVKIQFDAGFDVADSGQSGASGEDHPIDKGLKMVFAMLTGHYFKNREAAGLAGSGADETGPLALLQAYRQYW